MSLSAIRAKAEGNIESGLAHGPVAFIEIAGQKQVFQDAAGGTRRRRFTQLQREQRVCLVLRLFNQHMSVRWMIEKIGSDFAVISRFVFPSFGDRAFPEVVVS